MGPRKKVKTSEGNSTKVEKNIQISEYLENISETECARKNSGIKNCSELYLSLLPNEILFNIYQYLSPVDLLSLSHLDQRFSELTFSLKEANFSSCRRTSSQQVSSFFCRLRVKHIQKLNFNYNIFVKPSVLVQIICRCKDLRGLSIVECGIKYNHVLQILQSCTKLEELAWSTNSNPEWSLKTRCHQMKTVYLFNVSTRMCLKSIFTFMYYFPEVKNFFLNYAPDCLSLIPYHGVWLKSSMNFKFLKPCNVITSSFQPMPFNQMSVHGFDYITSGDSSNNDNDDHEGNKTHGIPGPYRVYECPPCLQIRSTENDVLLLSSEKAYSSLTILLTPQIISLSQTIAKHVQAIGDKLKHLSMQSEAYEVSANGQDPMPMSPLEVISVCEILEKVFHSCQNITFLNIATVHFSSSTPLKAISQLHRLKILNIPSCCLKDSFILRNSFSKSQDHSNFEEVVLNCKNVENFTLVCCHEDVNRICDVDMNPLKKWRELKHLSIYNIIFRTCSFLKGVAASCKELESLSLISVVPQTACIFVNDVIYVLKTAKKLSLIRINEPRFNPMHERLWDSIGEAVNLEGICILTEIGVPVVKRTVINAIKKLKYLHLFHFYHPRAPESLYSEVKKSMQEHGVNNIKVENDLNIGNFNDSSRRQFYHQQPLYCCRLLHLKDINIFS